MLDCIIVGAGAAGIAAARAFKKAGWSINVIEARARVGGRAFTTNIAGRQLDVGAHWMHMAERNPLMPLARALGFHPRPAPQTYPLYDSGERVVGAQRRAMNQGWPRLERNLRRLGEGDASLASVLPQLGEWTDMFAFDMALYSGAPADELSARDFARMDDGGNYFLASGYGALIARLAEDLPVRLNCAARAVRVEADRVAVITSAGEISARHAIIAVPVELLKRGAIDFSPALPTDLSAAINAFQPAAYEHAILHWPNSPLHENGADQLTFFKSGRDDGATMLACIDGGDFHYVELGGPHRAVWRDGDEQWKRAFVKEFLGRHFGAAAGHADIVHVTDWWSDPWSRGSWSVCPPGGSSARDRLRMFGERLRFAGEACSPTQWGTVGGAWREGARAALKLIEFDA